MGALVSPVVTLVRPAIISPLGNSSYSNNNYLAGVIDTSLFTFTRDSTAYLGSLLYASGVARTGTDSTWGQYLEVEESTTNPMTNTSGCPSVYTGNVGGTYPPTIALVTDSDNPFGTNAAEIVFPIATSAGYSTGHANLNTWFNVTSGLTYSGRMWAKGDLSYVTFYFTGGCGMAAFVKTGKTNGDWYEYSMKNNLIATTGIDTLYIYRNLSHTAAITVYVGFVQVENKNYPTSLVNGTRAAEVIYAPNSYITASKGTIAARFSVDVLTGSIQVIGDAAGFASTGLVLYVNASGYLEASYGSGSAQVAVTSNLAVTADTVYDAILTWSSSGVNLYAAASATGTVYTATSSTAPSISLNTNMYFGSNQGTQYFLNGKLYNVVGIGRALSSTEAAALIGTSWGVNLI